MAADLGDKTSFNTSFPRSVITHLISFISERQFVKYALLPTEITKIKQGNNRRYPFIHIDKARYD